MRFIQICLGAIVLTLGLIAFQTLKGENYDLVVYVSGQRFVTDHNLSYDDCLLATARLPTFACEVHP